MPRPPREKIPEPYGAIIDAVCDVDREWFRQHPGHRSYQRTVIWGEFWPLDFPAGTQVVVTEYQPGVRSRSPQVRDETVVPVFSGAEEDAGHMFNSAPSLEALERSLADLPPLSGERVQRRRQPD